MSSVDLVRMFAALESQMSAELARARSAFDHAGTKGGKAEWALRSFLETYMPRRLTIGHGEVIDLHGERSGQTDVVINNEDQAFGAPEGEPGLFIVEGVAAAGEVKSRLTTGELGRLIDAGVRFKQLRNTHPKGAMIHTNPSNRARFYDCPPFFGFCYESDVSIETLINRLSESDALIEGPISPIDGVFVLGQGCAFNFGDGEGSFRLGLVDGTVGRGWAWLESPSVLVDFVGWLNAVMPRILHFEPPVIPYLVKGEPGQGSRNVKLPRQ